ncbi:MAG: hypothetical protein HPY44_12980 [Armatimonadetes bacterium]|nr:hypothetical protein [Armatimonadota bacterium]
MTDAASSKAVRPALVITVDTEADNEWDHDREPSYDNISTMVDFQALCEHYGAKPTYLVTYDVAAQPDCSEILRWVSTDSRAEIGAHLHPWSTPPLNGDGPGSGHAYWYEYTQWVRRAKLERLTEQLTDVFGCRPTSFRAGRWGLDGDCLALLTEAGYTVDTSVAPLTSFRRNTGRYQGGPDFTRFPVWPYYPDPQSISKAGGNAILEVPVSAGVLGPLGAGLELLLRSGVPGGDIGRRALRKARLARRVLLQPVYEPLDLMIGLAKQLIAQGAPVLNIALHSSEWKAGYSPTITDQRAEEQMLARTSGLLEYLRPRTESMGLSEFAARWGRDRIAWPDTAPSH